jgi:hypothetical protein
MENNSEKLLLRNNPFFVIGIASLLAIGMFTVSFLAYYHSDTRKILEQIQANNLSAPPLSEADTLRSDELNATYIDELEKSIKEAIDSHPDDVEFSPDELTDSALGL